MNPRKSIAALWHMVIVYCVVFASVAMATNLYAEYLYVDNAAPCTAGSTCDGKSWATAWKSFSAIQWSSTDAIGKVGPGDILYISGGSSSKVYAETLTIGTSGNAAKGHITIDVGANSPSPSGHSGKVIIDGGNSRTYGINIPSRSYITVNGSSGSTFKMLIQNVADGNGSVYVRGSNLNIDYVQVDNATSRGIYLNYADNSRVRGCDVRTGDVSNNYQTDGIYIQYGSDNIIENNTVVLGNNVTNAHVDGIQVANGEARLIVRNNWFEWANGRGSSTCQVGMISGITDYIYFYNNVFLGSSSIPYQIVLAGGYVAGYGGDFYWMNNTMISRSQTAIPLRINNDDYPAQYGIGAIKNNIFYSNAVYGLDLFMSTPSASVIQGNLYYRSGGSGAISLVGGTQRTWAQHQAAGHDKPKGVNANPDYNSSDQYRLNPTSPCINAGVDLSTYFTTDRDGNTRPSGTGWDIGAYQYGASSTIKPPANLRTQ
jgi:parallel beta-helix repeat protein